MSATSTNPPSCAAPVDSATAQPAPAPGKGTYGQILKSSALIGGSSMIGIGVGIARTKIMALLLSPEGMGLMGAFNTIQNFALSIAAMGISSSGVRQIAEAVGSGETSRIARTVAVLRRTALFLGIGGAVMLVLLSKPVSLYTFESDTQTLGVALMAIAVFFKIVSDAQAALLQGMRRIGDLARISLYGSLFGAGVSIALVFCFGQNGVVPSLISIAGMSLLLSWWYSRKVGIKTPAVSMAEVKSEAGDLLKLGFAFMASGMMMMGSAYVVRTILIRELGLGDAGLYGSAWAIGGLYVGIILQAMGADFYPRLTAVIKNPVEANRLVNEQAHVGLLLAGPGVLGTITFTSLIISLLYSAKFGGAVEVLRWVCLGAMLQVITWPMGFIIVAKARQKIFFWCEFAYAAVHLGLAALGIKFFGLKGAGMAFFGSYLFHGVLIYPVVRRLTGFRWSQENVRMSAWLLPLIGLVFGGFYVLPVWGAIALGTAATLGCSIYSMRCLCRLVPPSKLPARLQPIAVWFGSDHFPRRKPRS